MELHVELRVLRKIMWGMGESSRVSVRLVSIKLALIVMIMLSASVMEITLENERRPVLRDVSLRSESCKIKSSKYLENLIHKQLFSIKSELLEIKRKKGKTKATLGD